MIVFSTKQVGSFEGLVKRRKKSKIIDLCVRLSPRPPGPFNEHDELANAFSSSAGNFFCGQKCCQRKVWLVFHQLVGCIHPTKLEIKGLQKTKSNAPIFASPILGAILIFCSLFPRNFKFGAQAGICHIIAKKISTPRPG